MDSSVKEPHFRVDEPVATTIGVVVEKLGLCVDVLIDGPTTLDPNQTIVAQLRAMFVHRGWILE